MYNNY